ncbi:hypothetical protein GCM10025872_34130 [Barrientosiimonas endolithica]|uniref:DUF222 domain-containing protein n=1 Tax=Barrientosiimonas endolithica TaxID=1535208 RepID=A0ABN6YS27_9MICO|nr:hypothetical protein GCM10025872_34130 [Barrientosiimonas endolithica]
MTRTTTHDTGLELIDPATHHGRDAAHLRAIIAAAEKVEAAQEQLADVVAEARRGGRRGRSSEPAWVSPSRPRSSVSAAAPESGDRDPPTEGSVTVHDTRYARCRLPRVLHSHGVRRAAATPGRRA